MMKEFSEKDKRALRIAAVCVAGVLLFWFAAEGLGQWRQVRKSLAAAKVKLEAVSEDEELLSKVPAFEMPQREEKQKYLFREKFNEQLKKAGIKSEPLQFLSSPKRQRQGGYRLLRLKCKGKGKFSQVLDLLANLKENPYLVGIEQMQIKCNPKKRQEIELDLTVSTYVK